MTGSARFLLIDKLSRNQEQVAMQQKFHGPRARPTTVEFCSNGKEVAALAVRPGALNYKVVPRRSSFARMSLNIRTC